MKIQRLAHLKKQPPQPTLSIPRGYSKAVESVLQSRILLCEDDPPTLLQLKLTFERFGCTVDTEVFGSRLFHKLESGSYDLVLMDYHLALMDADQAVADFLPWQRITLPMILMSAEDRRKDAEQLGFLDFYEKPITVSRAGEILHRFVSPFFHSPEIDADGFGVFEAA